MKKDKNKENNEEENDEEKDDNSKGLVLFVEKKEINEVKSEENKNYNDVNFWHVENIDDIKVDDILKELE